MSLNILPRRLSPGSTIMLVSPSAPAAGNFPHRLNRAIKCLESEFGFRIKLGPSALNRADYIAGNPEERASDIINGFSDPEVDGIICMIGGNHSNQLTQFLDPSTFKSNPKVFVGYSDITVLHLFIWHTARLTTFYGPAVIPEFGEHPIVFPYTAEYFRRAVMDGFIGDLLASESWTDEYLDWNTEEANLRSRVCIPNGGYFALREGVAHGPLLGGCINSLPHVLCTPFNPDWKGVILFIENSETAGGISLYDSLLHDLRNAGVFESIAGLLVGRPYHFSAEEVRRLYKLILSVTKTYEFPIIANVDFGHTDPKVTLPFGVETEIKAGKQSYIIVHGRSVA